MSHRKVTQSTLSSAKSQIESRKCNRTRPHASRQLQQSLDVVDPGGFPVAARGAEGLLQQVLLLPLDLHHPLLHRVSHNKLRREMKTERKQNKALQTGRANKGRCVALTFVTTTFLVCPSRWQRSMHCSSEAGFQAWKHTWDWFSGSS